MPNEQSLRAVIEAFDIPGECVEISTIKTGHINDTYRLDYREAGGGERSCR